MACAEFTIRIQVPIGRFLGAAVRLAVTAGLLWVLFSRVDTARVGEIFASMSFAPFIVACVALTAAAAINSARWHFVIGAAELSPGIATLVKITWVGLFFNQVLPTGVGGDAVRAWRCHLLGMRLGPAIRSILLDRAVGYAAIVILYAGGLPVLSRTVGDGLQQRVLLLVLVAAVAGLAALFCLDLLPAFLRRVKFIAPVIAISQEARRLVADRQRIAVILALAFVSLMLNIWAYERVAHSVGADVSFADLLVIVPLVALVQLIPISLAGWGVREAAVVVLMSGFGVASDVALATSLLFGVCLIVISLPGGLIWLFGWDVPRHGPPGRAEPATGSSVVRNRTVRRPKS